jgi:hypothetical protein
MIRTVCCVDAGKKRVRACPHLEESPQKAQGRGERTFDHLAAPPITTARLLSRHKAAEGTMAVRFGRPANWAEEFAATEPKLLPDSPHTRHEAGVWRICEKRGTGQA